MNTIWKFQIKLVDEQIIQMPVGAKILSVQLQDTEICIWAEVNSKLNLCARKILTCGTGNPIQLTNKEFIGTVQLGQYVWHVFESHYFN